MVCLCFVCNQFISIKSIKYESEENIHWFSLIVFSFLSFVLVSLKTEISVIEK